MAYFRHSRCVQVMGKRVSKLFSHHELRSCFHDPDVQVLLKGRLVHLLNYLYCSKKH